MKNRVDRDFLGRSRSPAGETPAIQSGLVCLCPEMGFRVRADILCRHVGSKQFEDQFAVFLHPLAGGVDLHPVCGLAHAGSCQHALTFHLDHAGAAVAVGAIAGRILPAQMRDGVALALSHLPDGFAGCGGDFPSVQREDDSLRFGHCRTHAISSGKWVIR